jgi:hypothetical protein
MYRKSKIGFGLKCLAAAGPVSVELLADMTICPRGVTFCNSHGMGDMRYEGAEFFGVEEFCYLDRYLDQKRIRPHAAAGPDGSDT